MVGRVDPVDVDRLFAVPRAHFVRERNALVRRLREHGRDDVARETARLPKPTLAVWAINQAARHRRPAVVNFLAAVDRWRKTYARGGAGVLAATEAERRALQALLAAAADALASANERVNPNIVRRISSTLRAAAASRESSDALRRGRMTREGQLTGFELVPHLRAAAPSTARAARRRP